MKKFIFYLLLIALFSHCQRELELDIPEVAVKPVISCLFSPDSVFKLNITKSAALNDPTIEYISDAVCVLYKGSTIVDTLNYVRNGFYLSKIYPSKGQTYSILIKINSMSDDEIVASSYVPAGLNLVQVSQQDFAVEDNTIENSGDIKLPFCRFSVTIDDPPDEKNYYELRILLKQDWNDSTPNPVQSVALYSYDRIIVNEDILDYKPEIVPFSDSLFNGQRVTIDFLYHPGWIFESYGNHRYFSYGKYRLIYVFRSISKEMYQYRKALIKHLYNQQTDNFEILGDPVQMYSNFINAYGIFAGYCQKIDTLFVDETDFAF